MRTKRPQNCRKYNSEHHVARENADAQARNIDAFGNHMHRDDPRVARFSESDDAARSVVKIGDDGFRAHADALFEKIGYETRVLLIHRGNEGRPRRHARARVLP